MKGLSPDGRMVIVSGGLEFNSGKDRDVEQCTSLLYI